jgi:signal transduction histidine kinase
MADPHKDPGTDTSGAMQDGEGFQVFAAAIAHDLNNLLAVMSGGLALLEQQIDGSTHSRVLAGLNRMVERGAALSRQLLELERGCADRLQAIDLAQHLHAIQGALDRTLRRDVRVKLEIAADLWPILTDPVELDLALLNLCINASDAMPGGGMIRFSAENVEPTGGELSGEFVRICIADNGIGMPTEQAFRPGVDLPESRPASQAERRLGLGLGLGLTQVHGFVVGSGGSLRIESTLQRGTTIELLLPRTDPPTRPL